MTKSVARFLGLLAWTSAFALAVSGTGCGDEKKKPGPSSTPDLDQACVKATEEELPKRCGAGEALCCARYVNKFKSDDVTALDAFGLACGGGDSPSCQIVRDSAKDPKWKLEVFKKACVTLGRATCQVSTEISFLLDPDHDAEALANYCLRTDDTEFRIAGASFACPKVPAEALAEVQSLARACTDGNFAACSSLADVSGGARFIFAQAAHNAWKARGLSDAQADQVQKRRVRPFVLGHTGPLDGSIVVEAEPDAAHAGSAAAMIKALQTKENDLSSCFHRRTHPKDGSQVSLDAIFDSRGVIAATSGAVAKPELETEDLPECISSMVQDTKIDGITSAGTTRVTVRFKK